MGRTVYIRKDPSDWVIVGSNTAWGMNVFPYNSVLGSPLYPLSRGFAMALPLNQGTDPRQLKKTEQETRKIEMSATEARRN
jgi:hypothetical protein